MSRNTYEKSRSRSRRSALVRIGVAAAVIVLAASGCSGGGAEVVPGGPAGHYTVLAAIHKIKHIIVIQQENRSFDSYFGTFPGADGIPMKNGQPTACVLDPRSEERRGGEEGRSR